MTGKRYVVCCLLLSTLIYKKLVSANYAEGTPVPIPNTEVKLRSGEDTRLETARENSSALTQYSSLAQSVERMTVNHDVAGSSPAGGAILKIRHICIMQICRIFVV